MARPIEEYQRQELIARSNRTSRTLWLVLLALFGIWSALILAAPVAASAGAEAGPRNLYGFFSYICHQQPSRSFFLLDHKFAVCSRCTGVYFGLFAGAFAYPLFRSLGNMDPLPRIYLILAMVPITVDWSLTFFGIWENTFFTRFVTGLILGVACAVFIIPALAEISNIYHTRRLSFHTESERHA